MARLLALLLTIGVCAAACAAPGQQSSSSAEPAPGGPAASPAVTPTGRTVRIVGLPSAPLRAVERLAPRHLAATGIALETSSRPTARDLVAFLGAEQGAGRSVADLALVPHRLLGELVQSGLVQPLAAPPEDDFFPGWWRLTGWFEGRPFGVPFAARSMSIWRRGDFWDEEDADAFYTRHRVAAGPPATWEAFERLATFQHRPEQERYGTVVSGADDDALWALWLQLATGFGARILDAGTPDEYGDIVVNSPEALRASEFYMRLLKLSPPGSAQFDGEAALRAYLEGKVALAIMWHDLTPRVDNPRESAVPLRSGYEPVPGVGGSAALLETLLLVPLAGSRTTADAEAALRWLTSADVQRDYTRQGGFSARPSAYPDPRVERQVLFHTWAYPGLVTQVVAIPSIPETSEIAALMSAELSRMVAGRTAPRTALDRMAVAIHQALAGRAKLRFPPRP